MATWHLKEDTLANYQKYPRESAQEVGRRPAYPNMEEYKKAVEDSKKRKKETKGDRDA